jgi:eukaryotic-like serine/threonine-protein kinase
MMLAITALLIVGLLASLHTITKHGQDAKVPKVVGLKYNAAIKLLGGFEVKVDSVYIPYKDPLEIVMQDPQPGNMVKVGRIIYITINKVSPPTIPMPALVNMSFRNAVLTLESYRLTMGDTIFKPDIAAGAILGQLYNGKPISAGSAIPVGSRIDLIVGAGLSDSLMDVPDLIGRSFAEARSLLDASGVLYNIVWDGSISDSGAAIIYEQQPESKNELDFTNSITPGDMIDLRIMQRPSAELLRLHQAGSRKFLDPNDTNAVISYGPATTELPSTNVDSINMALITKAKRKIKKAKTTEEEVNQIITEDPALVPNMDNTTPKTNDDFVGPKPEDNKEEKQKRALEDKAKKAMDAKNTGLNSKKVVLDKNKKEVIDKNKKQTNTVVDKNKNNKSKTKPTEPSKKKEAIKNKNKNDFSDEFK